MSNYVEWLEKKIEQCLEDKDLQREHWAFCQALKKYRQQENTYTEVEIRKAYFRGSNIDHLIQVLKQLKKD